MDSKLRSAASFALILAIAAATLVTAACPKPKKDALRSAVEASYRLPAATNDVIAKVADARDRGIITAEQARTFGTHLNQLARAEVVFVDMVKAAKETFDRTGSVDPTAFRRLRDYFDASLIEPFLRVLEAARLLSGTDVALITTAITAVRLILRTIGRDLRSRSVGTLNADAGPPYHSTGGRTAVFA